MQCCRGLPKVLLLLLLRRFGCLDADSSEFYKSKARKRITQTRCEEKNAE
jgi:hypothetical protein